MKRTVIISLLLVALLFTGIYFIAFQPLFLIVNGYVSKRVCSSHFIAERSLAHIEKEDLIYPASISSSVIDKENQEINSSVYGIAKQTAKYRPGFGCTLVPRDGELKPTPSYMKSPMQLAQNQLKQDSIFSSIDYKKLEAAIDQVFGTRDSTRAVLVLHKGKIVAEKYKPGFDKETELLGWSMTKSIANNLVGILVKQGKLSVSKQSLLPEWTDERSSINLEHLLHMSTDLNWNEEYGYLSDVTRMLYLQDNASEYAQEKDVRMQIGTSFIYSSGTTNIISKIIKNSFPTEAAYLKFPQEELFQKLGINAVMELDADNLYIMSSYTYMTARDWAKLGQFWLQKGFWNGEQVLPANWIEYSTTAGSGINSLYGAHFWLNTNSGLYPNVSADMYAARGFQGQHIAVIPSKETVIVRFGVDEGIETFDFDTFLSDILSTINI